MKDRAYWDRLHIAADKAPPVNVGQRPRASLFMLRGTPVRRYRGGFLREDRL
jgi:hypothetical protein